jgi:hypothetical protein
LVERRKALVLFAISASPEDLSAGADTCYA